MLSIVCKMGDYVFAAPTQILSDSSGCSNPFDVLQSLEAALKGKMPLKGDSVPVDSSAFCFKEYRRSARNTLGGLMNSLSNLIPEFSLAKTIPEHPLRPAGHGWDRVQCLEEELALEDEDKVPFKIAFFRNCPETGESVKDFYSGNDSSLVRMCFSADEGTEDA